jgi:hypothetical protein
MKIKYWFEVEIYDWKDDISYKSLVWWIKDYDLPDGWYSNGNFEHKFKTYLSKWLNRKRPRNDYQGLRYIKKETVE